MAVCSGPTQDMDDWVNHWRMIALGLTTHGWPLFGRSNSCRRSQPFLLWIDENGLWVGPDQDSVAGGWDPTQHLTGSGVDEELTSTIVPFRTAKYNCYIRQPELNHYVDLNGSVSLEMISGWNGYIHHGQSNHEAGRDADETELYNVTLTQGFYLGKYEVTQSQYKQ